MILSTTGSVPGRDITEIVGLVKGNTIRARNVGRDMLARLRHLVGGEICEYTKLMAESREQAIDRMKKEARGMGADAVIQIRFSTSMIMDGAAEILVYGTAVRLK